ncbi:IS3 family transposase [Neobacillus drentensis]|uniref:IS3 family transposase n=1 Tax=Neobacillus drentensis TaxID=220684 RepID=UPI002FFDE49C
MEKKMILLTGEYDCYGKLCTRVMAGGSSFLVDRTPLQLLDDTLNYIGYDLRGAIASAKLYGYRKIHSELRDKYNLPVSEKVVRRLMRELGLKSQARKEKRKSVNGHKVTSAGHIYENLLKRDFSTSKISEKWVTDLTEFPIGNTKLYLSSLMDLHDNYILGYQLSEVHDVQIVEDTLVAALETRKKEKGLIIHSDQGIPYRSNRWKELMDEHTITPSMCRKLFLISKIRT